MAAKWKTFHLGSVCSKIGSGATPRGGSSVYLDEGDVTLIRSQNIYNNGFRHDGLTYLTKQHAAELANVELLKDDVLLNITGDSVARSCQVDPEVLPARVNQHVAIIRPDRTLLWPGFLRYFLVSPAMQAEMRSMAGAGATRNALTKGMIEAFEVPAPEDVNEQRAIAHILGTLDDKIDLNRRMNETLEAIARAIFKSWFVDFDPVRAKMEGRQPAGMDPETAALFPNSFESSALGKIPKGWRVARLGDVAANPRRGAHPREIAPNTPYIGLEHMPRRSIALAEWGFADKVESNKFHFQQGEILFGKLRPYFHKVGVAPISGVCSTDILVLLPMSESWFGFVLGHVTSDEFVAFTDSASTGTKMPRTNWSDMAKYELVVPIEPIADFVTRMIQAMVNRITANISESRILAAIRDALLPKLISGEIRVKGG